MVLIKKVIDHTISGEEALFSTTVTRYLRTYTIAFEV